MSALRHKRKANLPAEDMLLKNLLSTYSSWRDCLGGIPTAGERGWPINNRKRRSTIILAVKRKLLEISNSVLFVAKDRLAVIASTDNVIDHRDVAKWESALKELLDNHLVDQRDSKGQILVITDLGYRIADMIEI